MSAQPATFSHDPVMVREITELFAGVPHGFVLDATLGGAGHTTAILDAHPGLSVLGLDRDPAALAASRERLAPYGDRVMLQHRRFDDLDAAMLEAGIAELSGALFDLGVSSHQFDSGERGFSYRHDAPLDMRMDTTEATTAADVVNQDSAVRRTGSGGRVAVLSYHSGEDRIIKARFKQHATGGCECPSQLPCGCGAQRIVQLVRVSSKPSAVEQEKNPRSTSARLRVAEVI